MLHKLKRLIPKSIFSLYHYILAVFSAFIFGYPSNKMIVIGVTGTNGKSSTVQFIAQLLEGLGYVVGYTTTAGFRIAGEDVENRMKMTMPGRFYLQKLMKRMVNAGCEYAVIETSSQGIEQFRHIGINYDLVLFTNLTPEHIESHGSFELYKQAKGKLFYHLMKRPHKVIDDKVIEKISIVNADDKYSDFFSSFKADKHVFFGFKKNEKDNFILGKIKRQSFDGSILKIKGVNFEVPLLASFQLKNLLASITTVNALGFDLERISIAGESIHSLDGRFEIIRGSQPFTVIVDYAYEPYAVKAMLKAVKDLKPKKIIGVHGSAGGGRDVARREPLGVLVGAEEDYVIITNEDPYDEDPKKIIDEVAVGVRKSGKVDNENLFVIDDRGEAIEKAVSLAKKGDIVVVAGKGNEPVMAVAGGKKVAWSDKQAVITALEKQGYSYHE